LPERVPVLPTRQDVSGCSDRPFIINGPASPSFGQPPASRYPSSVLPPYMLFCMASGCSTAIFCRLTPHERTRSATRSFGIVHEDEREAQIHSSDLLSPVCVGSVRVNAGVDHPVSKISGHRNARAVARIAAKRKDYGYSHARFDERIVL